MAKPLLRIGHLNITDHLILGVTKDKLDKTQERFDYMDLAVETRNDWTQIADALESGSLDGAFVLAPIAMDLFNHGVGMRLVLFSHKTGSILVKNKKANINRIEDFKGKSVLVPYQRSVHNMLFHQLLKKHGLLAAPGGVEGVDVVVEVVPPAMMNDFIMYDEEGEIGGFIVAEPIGSRAIKGGYAEEVCLSKDLWPDHPCCVLMMRDEIIGRYPDAVQEFTNSLVHSGRFVEENPAEAARIGAGFLNADREVVYKVLTDPPDRIKTGELTPVLEDLETMQDYMVNNMTILNRKVDLEKFVDLRFAEAAASGEPVTWGGSEHVEEIGTGAGEPAAASAGQVSGTADVDLSLVDVTQVDGVTCIMPGSDLAGGVSLAFVEVLRQMTETCVEELALDFSKVGDMDTRALRALVVFPDIRKRCRTVGNVSVRGLGGKTRSLFEVFPLNQAYVLEG